MVSVQMLHIKMLYFIQFMSVNNKIPNIPLQLTHKLFKLWNMSFLILIQMLIVLLGQLSWIYLTFAWAKQFIRIWRRSLLSIQVGLIVAFSSKSSFSMICSHAKTMKKRFSCKRYDTTRHIYTFCQKRHLKRVIASRI